jgi:hypothetical protein
LDVAEQHEVMILLDTSATQTGDYRRQSLAVLDSMLAALSDDTRVHLAAVDVNVVPLMEGFAAPGSAAVKEAIAKLARRAPLGATDLNTALSYAATKFPQLAASTARSAVYVGDGMCKASLLSPKELARHTASLKQARVAVTSCVVGTERNVSLLAAVANLTGGQVVEANPGEMTADKAGQTLSAMVATPVAWPENMQLPAGLSDVYPAQLPPLRADRDTILIGRMKPSSAGPITLSAEVQGKPLQFSWTAAAEASHPDFAFLPKLVDAARIDQGVTLSTLGSAGLRFAARNLVRSADDLVELGQKALAMGNKSGAERVASEALRRDPQNPRAKALLELATKGATDIVLQNAAGELNLGGVPAQAEAKGDSLLERFEKQEGLFLGDVERERGVKVGLVKAQVEETLKAARQMVADGDPAGAVAQLKLDLEKVERTPELPPETRQNLRDRLVVSIREAERRGVTISYDNQEKEQRIAQALEMQRVRTELANKEQKLTQLMQRFDSLMAERRYADAEADVVPEIANLAPATSIEQSSTWWGDFVHNEDEFRRLVFHRDQKFNDTLFQVELSHVPLPDEPPVIYPSYEKWEDITERRKKWKSVDLVKPGSAEARISEQLLQEITIEEPEIEIGRLMEQIASRQDITIVFDPVGLEEAGVTKDQLVSHNLKGITLRSALRLILGPLNLTYVIKDEVLQITSVERASEQLVTKVYPVGDLVVPIISNLGGGGGFGVGAGQGGAGFGGGGGGGGLGGGGGGLGGGGGGFGGGAFDVQDELQLAAAPAATVPTPAAGTPAVPAVRRPVAVAAPVAKPIVLSRAANESVEAAWDRYFAALAAELEGEQATAAMAAQSAASVRETVRELRFQKDWSSVQALILAALRHGQAQTWMYEALSIAMHAQDAPVEEIERALLSGVDLADNLDQVQYLALYMSKTGLERAALKLYRQLAALAPTRPEFYTQGLACARHLKDREGILWACEGILAQAWENRYRHLEREALNEGRAMILALQRENQLEEAKACESRLRAALARDCLVRISWTGEADLDMQMEEPSGTSCSVKTPRSLSGGVFLGDSFATSGKTPLEGYQETYVCPQAFAGEYRMLVQRVWGKVTAGKVTVDVILHQGTENERSFRQQIELGDKPALVVFNLEQGRRLEPLADQQIAHVARMQNALGRQILAQQIGNLPNLPGGTLSGYNPGLGGGPGGLNGLDPRLVALLSGRRGAVGFVIQPTILREGLEMFSNAVISADRRYVRVTPSPSITAISQVTTFNVATGAVGNGELPAGGGGAGGGGAGGAGAGGAGF